MTHDLFVSYAHADNAEGWVTFLRDALVEDHAQYRSGEVLDPFFDTHSIHHMDDWEHHILRGLQESRLFLAVLSPAWFKSGFCRRELREYLDRRVGFAVSGEGLLPVHFIEVPDQPEGWIDDPGIAEEVAWCREKLLGAQARLEPWFPAGEAVLGAEAVKVRVRLIADREMPSVQERIDRARIAEAVEGNVRATTPTFVGRRVLLRALHDAASLTTPGTVALIHGPGGFGKTELAVAYANEYRAEYGGGVWQISAESQVLVGARAVIVAADQAGAVDEAGEAREPSGSAGAAEALAATTGREDRRRNDSRLLAAIGTLAPDLGLMLTDQERADPAAAGRAVIAQLRAKVQRARAMQAERVAARQGSKRPVRMVRQAALVVLDNLDDPSLLGRRQLDQISAADWDWLRLVATTRISPDEFAGLEKGVKPVEVGPLSQDESLMLLREHQPLRQPGGVRRFADADQEQAAREIAAELGGLTLVVEQVAVHLGLGHGYPLEYVEPSDYLPNLRAAGASLIDEHVLGDDAERDALRHQDAVMAYVMDTTLAQLPPEAAMALRVAALMPVDAVPWPWVAQIITNHGAGTAPGKVVQILTGRRLMTRTADDELLRIHRIHAEHLAADAAEFEPDVVSVISEAVEAADPGGAAAVWQLRAVVEAALPRLVPSGELVGLEWGGFIETAFGYLGAAVLPMAEALVAARRALYDGTRDNRTYQLDLAVGLGDWAGLVRNFDPARADGYYAESVALLRALYDGSRDNRTYQLDLAIGLGNWAGLVEDFNPARADGYNGESVALLRALYDGSRDNRTYQRGLAIGLAEWAGLVQNWDSTRADGYYKESVTLHRALYDGTPDNRTYQRGLAVGLAGWAGLVRNFDPARADGYYAQSVALYRALYEGARDNRIYQRGSAIGLGEWAGLVRDVDPARADGYYGESVALHRALYDGAPDNQTYQHDLAIGLAGWAGLVQNFDPARADGYNGESVALLRALYDGSRDNRTYQRDLAAGLGNWARLVRNFDPARADGYYGESVALHRALHDGTPDNQTYQRDLATGLGGWAGLVQNFDPARADGYYAESVALYRALYDGARDNRTYQRDLATGLGGWARLVRNFDPARADGYYGESVALHRALYDGAPDNRTYQRDLAIGLVDWSLHRERSDLQVPMSDWADACRLWKGLAAVRKLQDAEEQYRALACSRALGDRPAT